MTEKAASDLKGELPPRGLVKAADYINKIMSPVSTYIAYFGAAVLGGLVLMLLYSILARRLLSAPLRGSFELTELSLVLITFMVLAYDNFKHESMVVDVVISHLPQRPRVIIAPIIHLLTMGMLCVLCWQLVVQGMRVQGFRQTTPVLELPLYPFLYVAAFGVLLLTVIYLKHFLYSLNKAVNR